MTEKYITTWRIEQQPDNDASFFCGILFMLATLWLYSINFLFMSGMFLILSLHSLKNICTIKKYKIKALED